MSEQVKRPQAIQRLAAGPANCAETVCSRLAAVLPAHRLPARLARPPALHQVYEKKVASLAEFNLQNGSSTLNAGGRPSSGGGLYSPDKLRDACTAAAAAPWALRIPRVVGTETLLATRCKRSYSNAHTYHINSIALSSDCETFISADDLRINLWHLDRWGQSCRCGWASGQPMRACSCYPCGKPRQHARQASSSACIGACQRGDRGAVLPGYPAEHARPGHLNCAGRTRPSTLWTSSHRTWRT